MVDLPLPSSFVQLIVAIRDGGWPHFVLRWKADAYGEPFDNDLNIMLMHDDPEFVRDTTHLLLSLQLKEGSTSPHAELNQRASGAAACQPGFIPAVTDFTKIISFGTGRENSLYCFDYRTNLQKPGVICWQDNYWRRVSPDFKTFLALYKLGPNRFQKSDVGYWEMEEARITRMAEALSRI